MIVYVPTLIESVEQAEQLPVGAIALHLDEAGLVSTAARRCRCAEPDCDAWFTTDWNAPYSHADMVGWTALVPVGAHEETHSVQTRGQAHPEWRTRLVTPWEPTNPTPSTTNQDPR